ncbi:twitching motility protein PilT [Dulcicalothrix desertica PCC 7102]|uniref:Twitching motility protein PilT n=1 Tax=Dulcicalothrix desertica PCC 7102 TaxID=232991 RepID=A0A433VTW4_9CYAN|nr:type II toxin-antitoxin system VapC family toxin [Dulcicalothrix desertica]RUT09531.1 twitching motility protein PilT [Dulcicalothrix desertica PCC 7102]TWH50728.1 PIN domain nuclease of toxin-antitoxin system [Dulcicalothrix desertica PCC 7102]
MRLLLDTHVLIWLAVNPELLSEKVSNLLTDDNNFWVLSIASVWEIQIKVQLGKLDLPVSVPELIASQQEVNNMQILPIELSHVYALQDLPNHHRDPFDRIIIVQAIFEKMPLLSVDEAIAAYSVEKIW